jgi:hypothetical protein
LVPSSRQRVRNTGAEGAQDFATISAGYVRALRRAIKDGEITTFTESDLEPLTYMLMSIRTYLAQRYAYSNGIVRAPDEQVINTYVKFDRNGLFGVDEKRTSRRRGAPRFRRAFSRAKVMRADRRSPVSKRDVKI